MTGQLSEAAPVFAALGDGTRLSLVGRLCEDGPCSITRLSAGFNVSRQAVTRHLHVLAEVGLVREKRCGRESIWEVEKQPLLDAQDCLQAISRGWDRAIERLRNFVED